MPSFVSIAGRGSGGSRLWSIGRGQEEEGRTLGPCAETMGVTTGLAFWLSVAQLPVMIGLALHYPTVRVDLYVAGVRTIVDKNSNQTAVAAMDGSAVHALSYEHGVAISGLYVLNAASFTFFAVLTMNFLERGLSMVDAGSSPHMVQQMGGEEFVSQNVGMLVDPAFRMWNQVGTWICTIERQSTA